MKRLFMLMTCWFLVVSLFSIILGQEMNLKKECDLFESALVDYQQFDGNQIRTWTSNQGDWVVWDQTTSQSGLEWPKGSEKYAVFHSGFWLVCGRVKEPGQEFENEIRTATVRWKLNEFQPGQVVYWDTLGNFETSYDQYPRENCIWKAQNPEDPKYRYYKINRGETLSEDYLNWPIDQGAPVDKDGNPLIIGDQTMWSVYNDAEQKNHDNQGFTSLPLGVEIQTTLFGFAPNDDHQLESILFIKNLIINKSDNYYDEMYVAIWADPDLGEAIDDYVGVDTSLALGYCFNGRSPDAVYGINPPSVGFSFLQRPQTKKQPASLSPGKDNPPEEKQPTELSSFIRFTTGNVYYDPDLKEEVYNLMRGLSTKGDTIINPVTEKPTRFMLSGDPITSEGWTDHEILPGDRRFILSTGPFAMAPTDSQEVVTAILVTQGETLVEGIRLLKIYQVYAKKVFDANFHPSSFSVISDPSLPQNYQLKHNYPNPFNPTTTISYSLPFACLVELNVYNIYGQKVQELVNQRQPAGTYYLTWDGTKFSSGIYFFQIKTHDFIKTRKMILIK